MILVLLLGWIVFAYVFAALAPYLLEGLRELIGFLLLCLWEVVKLLLKGLAWVLVLTGKGIGWAAARSGNGVYLGFVFIFYIADEWWRGPREDEPEEEFWGEDAQAEADAQAAEEEQAEEDAAYAAALARFGLAPGFTQGDLNSAYKRAIRKAHPDAGGSVEEAQTVNTDRDLIARAHGWA